MDGRARIELPTRRVLADGLARRLRVRHAPSWHKFELLRERLLTEENGAKAAIAALAQLKREHPRLTKVAKIRPPIICSQWCRFGVRQDLSVVTLQQLRYLVALDKHPGFREKAIAAYVSQQAPPLHLRCVAPLAAGRARAHPDSVCSLVPSLVPVSRAIARNRLIDRCTEGEAVDWLSEHTTDTKPRRKSVDGTIQEAGHHERWREPNDPP